MKERTLKIINRLGIGMRTLKTLVALGITFLIAWLVNYDTPFYAGIAAILTIQPTPKKSIEYGKQRMVGTLVAGVISVLMVLVYGYMPHKLLEYLCLIIAVLIGFILCNLIKCKSSCAICGIVILAVMINHLTQDKYYYVISRVIETLVGIIVATGVNFIPSIPKKVKPLEPPPYQEKETDKDDMQSN